jgi:hypothetical protein
MLLANLTLSSTLEQLPGDLFTIGLCRWNSVHKLLDVVSKIVVLELPRFGGQFIVLVS